MTTQKEATNLTPFVQLRTWKLREVRQPIHQSASKWQTCGLNMLSHLSVTYSIDHSPCSLHNTAPKHLNYPETCDLNPTNEHVFIGFTILSQGLPRWLSE